MSFILILFFSILNFENAQTLENSKLPLIHIIGDSTAHNSGEILGWGDVIANYFDLNKIGVVNYAKGGRSARSFRNEGLWKEVLGKLNPGDWVFIQFGHNDSAGVEDKRYKGRGDLHGTGEETVETLNTPDSSKEVVHTYGWYISRYAEEVKAKGANLIIFSPVPRNYWNSDGTFKHAMKVYTPWAKEIAEKFNFTFIDLETIISTHYVELGKKKVSTFFPNDGTHTSPEGADFNAKCVIEGLKMIKNLSVNKFIK